MKTEGLTTKAMKGLVDIGTKVLIVGHFTEKARGNIIPCFPGNWEVNIASPGEEVNFLGDCEILIPEHIPVNKDLLAKAPSLRLVQTGAGFDNVDIEACTEKGVWAANSAGVNAMAVAEHTLALILAYYKNISYLDNFMKSGGDERFLDYTGGQLLGETLGIVGLGAIGRKVAALGNAFGMRVIAYDISENPEVPSYVTRVSMDEIYEYSDIISLHIFLNRFTKGLISTAAIKKMKNTVLIVNTARGGLIRESDLLQALEAREIGGACLDVFEEESLAMDSPLRKFPNVILTPHTAGMPDGLKFHRERYDFFVRNIKRVLKGEKPLSSLNTIATTELC